MKSFRLQNIKSFIDSGELNIKPITVFVGPNSCGKSSLLRFMSVLAQKSAVNTTSPLLLHGKMVDYGSYDDVIHHDMYGRHHNDFIHFELVYTINMSKAGVRTFPFDSDEEESVDNRDVTLKVTAKRENNRVVIEEVRLDVENINLYYIFRDKEKKGNSYTIYVNAVYENHEFIEKTYNITLNNVVFDKFVPSCIGEFPFNKKGFQAIAKKVLNEYSISDDEVTGLFFRVMFDNDEETELTKEELQLQKEQNAFGFAENILALVMQNFEHEMKELGYIGPFRIQPDRLYRDPEYKSSYVGVHGEHVANILIDDFHNGNNSRELIDKVSDIMHGLLGVRLDIINVGDDLYKFVIVDDNGIESNLIDTGYGISQVLPIITQIIKSGFTDVEDNENGCDDRIVCIEQPELHLHPAAQAKLASLFETATLNNPRLRLLIETHSEHLLRKLQVFIADPNSNLTKDMVAVYYVDKDKDGVSYIREMKICEDGRFEKEWPSGFFDQAFQLSMQLTGM